MKIKDINRVVIGVKDLDEGMAFYSKLLNASFYEVSPEQAEPYGHRVAISWEGRVELVAPLGDDRKGQPLVETREGLIGVIFNVDDVEGGRERAEEMGVRVSATVELGEEQIRKYHENRFAKFKEYFLHPGDTGKVAIILGQIEAK